MNPVMFIPFVLVQPILAAITRQRTTWALFHR